MKRFNLAKGISAALVAMGLAVSLVVPVTAAKTDMQMSQEEVSQVGAAPFATTLVNTTASGQHNDSWNFQASTVVPKGGKLMCDLYRKDSTNKSSGWRTYTRYNADGTTVEATYFNGATLMDEEESVGSVSAIREPGTYILQLYYFDGTAYDAAKEATKNALQAANPNASVYMSDYYDYCRITVSTGKTYQYTYVYKADYVTPAQTFTLTADLQEPGISTAVKSTSVQLDFGSGYATGYEVYRKIGKKYQKLATVTKKTFTDNNLSSKTKYSYKVRAYYKDEKTGKVSYSKYTLLDCTTKGSALKLQAKVEKKKNIKLSWTKVSGATKYEVYRHAEYSQPTTYSKGQSDAYNGWELIKTLKNNKKSYVDKQTNVNMHYSYIVRAVLSADKKVKGDKTQFVEAGVSVSLGFGGIGSTKTYTDAKGNKTVEWQKVYGAQGYIIEKAVRQIDPTTGEYKGVVWTQVTKLNASATKYTFPAVVTTETYGATTDYLSSTDYRIYAYKDGGKTVSESKKVTTYASLGVVKSVTAKKTANGIQVSWTPVADASYYQVYRLPAGSLIKDKDDGTVYSVEGGSLVTEYVGVQAPVAVDVAAYNAAIDAYKNDITGTVAAPIFTDKLDAAKTYYYRNYQYARSRFTGTSMVDYSGPVYRSGLYSKYNPVTKKRDIWGARPLEVEPNTDYNVGPKMGVTYQYVVVAYKAQQKTVADYQDEYTTAEEALEEFNRDSQIIGVVPGTTNASVVGTEALWKDSYLSTAGCAKIGEACYTNVTAPKAPAIKSVKSSKKTVTIKLKKKVSGATAYKIYRADKKKGKYICVGTTTTTSFKDTGLKAGKTYYYKVAAVATNEANADVESKASKPKSVKVK